MDPVTRGILVLERQQCVEPEQILVLPADIGENFRSIALGIAEHALRSSAVSEPEILEMSAAKAELDRAEPKIPVFEAELHALVEPGTPLEYGAPDQAAGLADVFLEMTQHRVRAGVVAVPFLP